MGGIGVELMPLLHSRRGGKNHKNVVLFYLQKGGGIMYIDTHTKEAMEQSICSYLCVTPKDLRDLFEVAGNEAQQDKFIDGDKLNEILDNGREITEKIAKEKTYEVFKKVGFGRY